MNAVKKLSVVTQMSAILVLSGLPVHAQTKAPFMEGYPFSYEGKIGGMDAWSLPGEEDLWMVMPDGQTVVAGFVFSGRGMDLGSALLGLDPIDVQDSLMGFLEDQTSNRTQIEDFPDMDDLELEGRINQSAVALDETVASVAPQLEAMSDDMRDELLIQLVEKLEAAETPEDFQMQLVLWHDLVTGQNSFEGLTTEGPEGNSRSIDQDEASLNRIDPAMLQSLDVLSSPSEASQDVALLDDLANSTMWFGIGNPSARPVYMVYDPSCPFCARALQNLEGQIQRENIHLRIIMVPAVSDQSLGLTSAILQEDFPGEALIRNARHITAHGRPEIQVSEEASVDPQILEGISRNLDVMREYEIPGVPFFGWHDDAGPRFFAGVPQADKDFSARN